METVIQVNKNRMVGDLQEEFSKAYPFLKLEFYTPGSYNRARGIKQRLTKSSLMRTAGLKEEGEFIVTDAMIVRDLENTFQHKFGALVQVSRKSGPIWLETTLTDSWTLKQQNEHGRELSLPVKKDPEDDLFDYD